MSDLFLSDEGTTLETLDFAIRIGSTQYMKEHELATTFAAVWLMAQGINKLTCDDLRSRLIKWLRLWYLSYTKFKLYYQI